MRKTLLSRILLIAAFVAGLIHADVMYTIPASSTDTNGDSVSGFVDFFLSGCSSGGTNCILNIELQNTQTGTEVANQAISGVTFELSNAGTALGEAGALIGTSISTTGGAAVTTIKQSNGSLGTTTTPGTWKVQQHPTGSTTWGTGSASTGVNFTLDDHPGTTTATGMIVTSSSGGSNAPGTDHSFSGFTPSYMGPVYFQITGISGLTTSTDISNISILFGDSGTSNSPTGYFALSSTNCTAFGTGDCSSGLVGIPSVPEPVSFLLAGSGFLALAFIMRRRYLPA